MRIFLSWSGLVSKQIAQMLHYSLPNIIQALDVFYSEEDIDKGEFWPEKITEEIDKCDYAIVCLTSKNFNSRWINFEAGMMCRKFNKDVCVINFDIEGKIEQPLCFFQEVRLDKDDFFKLIKKLNENIEKPLKDMQLKKAFDNEWKDMEEEIASINDSFIKKENEECEEDSTIEQVKKLLQEQNIIIDSKLSKLSFENLEFEFRKDDEKVFISTSGQKREIQSEQNYYR